LRISGRKRPGHIPEIAQYLIKLYLSGSVEYAENRRSAPATLRRRSTALIMAGKSRKPPIPSNRPRQAGTPAGAPAPANAAAQRSGAISAAPPGPRGPGGGPPLPEALVALLRKAETFAAASDWANAQANLQAMRREFPDRPEALLQYGVARLRAEHLDQAIQTFRDCINAAPGLAPARKLLGIALSRKGLHDEAIAHLEAASQQDPKDPDTWFYWAQALAARKDFNGALTRMSRANALRPEHAPYLHVTGSLLSQAGADKRALPILFKALDLSPTMWAARMTLGHVLMRLGRHKEAISHYTEVLQDAPDRFDALTNIGNAYAATDQFATAEETLKRLVELHPADPVAWSNLANLYSKMNRYEDSLVHYEKALALRPDYPEALNNYAITLRRLNRTEESIEYLQKAIAQREGFPDANWNLSLSLLLAGRLEEGFEAYEWRWRGAVKELRPRKLNGPAWKKGEPIAGKRLLVHSEQGLGDHIQYLRYLPVLRAMGATVIAEVPEPLLEICRDFDTNVEWFERGAAKMPAFDLYTPMMSLPWLLGTRIDNIPASAGYFRARDDKIALFRERLAAHPGFRVGLVWSGNPRHLNDRNRSLTLAPLLEAFAGLPVTFVSVMKEVRPHDREHMDATGAVIDFSAALDDFTDTAGLVANLDLVISVDTSVAHLVAALGRPIWNLLPFSPDWRWMNDRTDTPWYDTMTLYRQSNPHDWDSVLKRAAIDLRALVAAAPKGSSSAGTARP
jgi:tetratricopeptide (TPR) repeat protein